MKFRKLLAGAAVAALTAGTASALDLTLENNGAGGTTTIGLANEGNNIAASDTVTQIVRVTTDAPIAAANNYLVTITVTGGGSFGRNVVGADLGIVGSAVTFNGTNVQFDGSDRTGEEGDKSVRFLGSASVSGSNFLINVPIKTDCSGPVSITVTLATEAGTAIEEGTATLATGTGPTAVSRNSIACVEAYSASIATDDTATANDSVVTVASLFRNFLTTVTAPAAAGGAADTATVATLGTTTVTFDPTNATAAGGAVAGGQIFANLGDVGGAGPLPITPLADAEFTLTTSSRTGIASLDTGAFASATATSVAIDNTVAGTVTGNNTVAPIIATLTGTATVAQPTTVTASAATLNYTSAAQGLTDEAIALVNSGVLDLINYQAGICGTFDWVGDANTTRRNVWRVTGAPSSVANGVFASMTNSSAGVAASTRQITPAVSTAQEIIITDAELTTAFGNFGRADFSFSFAGDLSGFDCDRLQSSPAASIVTPFGNGTAGTPGANGDGDD